MTLTLNGRTIETDDPKVIQEAIREARKAESAERKERKRLAELRAQAQARAESKAVEHGYWLLERKASGEGFSSIEFYPPGARYSPARIERTYPTTRVQVSTAPATGTLNLYGMQYHGCIAGMSGIAVAVFLSDDETHDVRCYAIGGEKVEDDPDGVWTLKPCPGITPEDFQRAES